MRKKLLAIVAASTLVLGSSAFAPILKKTWILGENLKWCRKNRQRAS
jgi:hypothetical protein